MSGSEKTLNDYVGCKWDNGIAKEIGWNINESTNEATIVFPTKEIPECYNQATSADITITIQVTDGLVQEIACSFTMYNMHAGLEKSWGINPFSLAPVDKAKALAILEKTTAL